MEFLTCSFVERRPNENYLPQPTLLILAYRIRIIQRTKSESNIYVSKIYIIFPKNKTSPCSLFTQPVLFGTRPALYYNFNKYKHCVHTAQKQIYGNVNTSTKGLEAYENNARTFQYWYQFFCFKKTFLICWSPKARRLFWVVKIAFGWILSVLSGHYHHRNRSQAIHCLSSASLPQSRSAFTGLFMFD